MVNYRQSEMRREAEANIVNAEGSREGLSPEMNAFFDYLTDAYVGDNFTEALETEVEKAREHIEWRTDYMSLLEKYEIEREEGREEGRAEGIGIGRAEGIGIGEKKGKASMLEQLLAAGIITPEQAKQFA